MLNNRHKFLIIIELSLLILGVSLPLATIDEFWFFSSEFSLLSLTFTLFNSHEYILSLIVIFFGFIVPMLKIFRSVFASHLINALPLEKFSMLDIFLLSFLIYGGKLSYFYDVDLKIGFYFLLSSICLSYFSVFKLLNSSKK